MNHAAAHELASEEIRQQRYLAHAQEHHKNISSLQDALGRGSVVNHPRAPPKWSAHGCPEKKLRVCRELTVASQVVVALFADTLPLALARGLV